MELAKPEFVSIDFIKNIIKFDKKKGIAGVVFALISLLGCGMMSHWLMGAMYAVVFLAIGFLKIEVKGTAFKYIYNIIGLSALILAMCFVEYRMMGGKNVYDIPNAREFYNYVCVLIVYVIVFVIFGDWKRSIVVASSLLIILATSNCFVYQFRGKEMGPFDILTIGTGISVMGQYIPEVNINIVNAWIMGVLAVFFQFTLPTLPKHKKIYMRIGGLVFGIIVYIVLSIGASDLIIRTWGLQGTNNGYYLNFYLGIRDSAMKKPKNYSEEGLEELESQYAPKDEDAAKKNLPNILVIMNESFADFRVFNGEINTNKEVTPFIDSLEENTIKGFALSSVYGGETANSEFEFLTSHSMAFLPTGTVPYQQFINKKTYSLAWLLSDYGYDVFATHPYGRNGWSRVRVYPKIGFPKSTFAADYPQKKMLRDYISDREDFEYVLDIFNKKEKGEPLFLFNVTMQNHGGYTYKGERFQQSIELVGYDKEYPKAEQYLSCIHETDKAVQYLIEELENYEEETIVVFFGDHFPKVENEFYEELLGGAFEETSDQMLKYKVPFFIWANYDIEEANVELTSLNFLSQYLLEEIELNKGSYNQLISDVQKEIPAMNAMGYYSKDKQKFIKYEEAEGKEAELLNEYAILQYNNMFDKKHRSDVFFERYIQNEE